MIRISMLQAGGSIDDNYIINRLRLYLQIYVVGRKKENYTWN